MPKICENILGSTPHDFSDILKCPRWALPVDCGTMVQVKDSPVGASSVEKEEVAFSTM